MRTLFVAPKVGDLVIRRVLIDGGASVNLMPASMLKRLGETQQDLLPHTMSVTDFCGRLSNSEGMICLDLKVGSIARPTMFVVMPSKANYNLLLGREWIHGIGAIPSTLHQTLVFWNNKGAPEYTPSNGRYFTTKSEAMMAQEGQSEQPGKMVEDTLSLEEVAKALIWVSTSEQLRATQIERRLTQPKNRHMRLQKPREVKQWPKIPLTLVVEIKALMGIRHQREL